MKLLKVERTLIFMIILMLISNNKIDVDVSFNNRNKSIFKNYLMNLIFEIMNINFINIKKED